MRSRRFFLVWLKDLVFVLIRRAKPIFDKWILFLSTLSFFVVVYDFGFYTTPSWQSFTRDFFPIVFLLFFTTYVSRILYFIQQRTHNWRRYSDYLIAVILFLSGYINLFQSENLTEKFTWLLIVENDYYSHFLALFIFAIEISKGSLSFYKIKFNPSLLFTGSFFFLIVIGSGLLMLPRTSYVETDFIDALFTSASAVCVTGLIVVDTATHFTLSGQIIIMILFQIGGLSVMIFTSFFGFFFQGSPSFQNQLLLKDILNENQLGRIMHTLTKILGFTLLVELSGALFIFITQNHPSGAVFPQIWHAVFHSVSAFCNAGFSVYTLGLADASMGAFQNYNMHLVIALLIILGGIGFPVILNYTSYLKHKFKANYEKLVFGRNMHNARHLIHVNTRIVVNTTLLMLVIGFAGYWILENENTLAGMSTYGKIVTSLFGSVTPRTAGYNTVDPAAMLVPTILLTIFLMWVGASPSSCGGGIKTSTLAIAVLNITSMARGKDRLDVFRRNIGDKTIRRAFSIIVMSLVVIGLAIFILSITDGHLGMKNIIFECFSAFSTVGLSLGITSQLSDMGKLVIIFLMFIGRIGTLTLVVAFFRKLHSYQFKYPKEQIFIN